MFENYQPPALFLSKSSVLASFSCGKQTSLVVDCGWKGITVSAVHDGYCLKKSMTFSQIGGKLLTDCMASVLEKKNKEDY